jgi:two-component sensor histidine kinase
MPVGFIINGLVSNARKHAFPEGNPGDITIQLDRGGATHITLVVRDDGIGFAEHVDFRYSPSVGLTIVNALVT